jgi:hypothetical protein
MGMIWFSGQCFAMAYLLRMLRGFLYFHDKLFFMCRTLKRNCLITGQLGQNLYQSIGCPMKIRQGR